MRRWVFIALFLLFVQNFIYAQLQNTDKIDEAIVYIFGLSSIEEIDEDLLERMLYISGNPLKINNLSRAKLLSSGLFTQYQVASFLDYRDRYGDVLSYSELGALNGYNPNFVEALKPFISLDSSRLPGQSRWEGNSIYNKLIARGFFKNDDEQFLPQYSYALRYSTDINQKYFFRAGLVRSYDSKFHYPSAFTVTLAYQSKRLSFVLGDFNLRFGQGIALWNGMSLAGVSNVSSFLKKPTGLSLPSSFSSPAALTGIASDVSFRNFTLTTFVSMPKLRTYVYKPPSKIDFKDFFTGLNLSYYGSRYRLALTQANTITSIDAALCIRGVDIWGELAIDWLNFAPSSTLGVAAPIEDRFRIAGLIRYFSPKYKASYNGPVRTFSKPLDELGASLGMDFSYERTHIVNLALDYAMRPSKLSSKSHLDASQFKALLSYNWIINSEFDVSLRGASRLKFHSDAHKITYRNELRSDFGWERGCLGTRLRLHGLWAKGFAILGYCEAKYKLNSFICYLRQGIFKVDSWDDRIYVYERDLPGSFSVPAYYGRGVWTAFYMKYSIKTCLQLGFRAAYTPYFKKKKPSKAELKFQIAFDF